MRPTPAALLAAALLLSPVLAACGGDDDDGGDPAEPDAGEEAGPLYLVATWVADQETTNTYIGLTDSLEIDAFDLTSAIEIPGYADAWVDEGRVYVAAGDAPTVTRYAIGADDQLEPGLAVSFANYGALGAAFWHNQILSADKAYLANAAEREYVAWNPDTMEITGTVAWPETPFDAGLEPFHSYTDRGGVVADGKLFHGIYGQTDFNAFGDRSYVGVYDVATDELLETIEVPCPMMDVATVDGGYVYLSGWSYMPLSYLTEQTPKNCAARIEIATLTVDAEWTIEIGDLTAGEQGSALRAIGGGDGILAVFHGSGIDPAEVDNMWDLDAGDDDWELYALDLETRETTPTGVLFSDGSFYESHMDGRYYVYLGVGGATQVFERTDGGEYLPKFTTAGWMSRLFRVR